MGRAPDKNRKKKSSCALAHPSPPNPAPRERPAAGATQRPPCWPRRQEARRSHPRRAGASAACRGRNKTAQGSGRRGRGVRSPGWMEAGSAPCGDAHLATTPTGGGRPRQPGVAGGERGGGRRGSTQTPGVRWGGRGGGRCGLQGWRARYSTSAPRMYKTGGGGGYPPSRQSRTDGGRAAGRQWVSAGAVSSLLSHMKKSAQPVQHQVQISADQLS